jgi:hypothetical protein
LQNGFGMRKHPALEALAGMVAWIALSLTAGCGQPAAIGGPCDIGVPPASGSVTISTPALECDGRVCMQVGSEPAFCSAECRTDDDCRTVAPANGQTCRQGFACAAATASGKYACRPLCICRDDRPVPVACVGAGN